MLSKFNSNIKVKYHITTIIIHNLHALLPYIVATSYLVCECVLNCMSRIPCQVSKASWLFVIGIEMEILVMAVLTWANP